MATSDKYNNAGGRPLYYKQYDHDAEVSPQTLDKDACLRVFDHLEKIRNEWKIQYVDKKDRHISFLDLNEWLKFNI